MRGFFSNEKKDKAEGLGVALEEILKRKETIYKLELKLE